VTLSRSIYEPFMSFSDRRDLREKVFEAFIMRGQMGGKTDNTETVREHSGPARREGETARLRNLCRAEARRHHGQDAACGTRAAGAGLGKAREKASADERTELQRIAAEAGSNDKIAGWDWRYYQEKLRAEKYAFDEAELKPYLQLERVIAACFDVATRLFGITFVEEARMPGLAP
jgi:peptidyl-dipeptidase Dcp